MENINEWKKQIPLKLGKKKSLSGIEPSGCFNSGFNAVIYRSCYNGKYLVGIQIDVQGVINQKLNKIYPDGGRPQNGAKPVKK